LYVVSTECFVYFFPQAWQVYCMEGLHPLVHPITATVLRETVEQTLCILKTFYECTFFNPVAYDFAFLTVFCTSRTCNRN
jgi:hypothetical protein